MTMFDRAGAAFGAGAPIGAAFGVAKTSSGGLTLTPGQAAGVGAVLAGRTQFGATGYSVAGADEAHAQKVSGAKVGDAGVGNLPDLARKAYDNSGLDSALGWVNSHVWEPTYDYYEASNRRSLDVQRQTGESGNALGNIGNSLRTLGGLIPFANNLDPNFREDYWTPARKASEAGYGASIMQTTWEMASLGDRENRVDPRTGRAVLPLIDDPEKYAERNNYFNRGAQKWITGVGDGILNVALDPTVVGLGAAGVGRKALTAVRSTDIATASKMGRGAKAARDVAARDAEKVPEPVGAKVAGEAKDVTPGAPAGKPLDAVADAGQDLAIPGVPDVADDLVKKYKPTRFQRNVEKLTDYMDSRFGELREGGSGAGVRADMLNDPLVKRMGPEAGLIVDAASWVSSTFTDDGIRKGVMDDVWLAGMGDRQALDRIGQVSERMRLDLEGIVSPDAKVAREGLDASPYLSTAEKWNLSNSDELWQRQRRIIEEDVDGFSAGLTDRLDQVRNEGRLGLDEVGEFGASASVTEIPLTTRLRRRIQTGKSIRSFNSLPPVRVLTGTHVPHTLDLTDDQAVGLFDAHVRDSLRVLGRAHDAVDRRTAIRDAFAAAKGGNAENRAAYQAAREEGAGVRDAFATTRGALEPGAARSQRSAVVKKFNDTMTDNLASKLAREKGWDKAEVREWIMAARRQWKDDVENATTHMRQAAVSMTPDGVPFAPGRDLKKAISQGQFQQVEALMDWKRLDKQLRAKFMPGVVEKPGETLSALAKDTANTVLSEFTDAWKFAALLRPVAYPLRVQMDTQFRNLATMGVADAGLMALHGTGNALANLGRVDRAAAALYERKVSAATEVWSLDDRLAGYVRADGSLADDAPTGAARWLEQRQAAQKMLDTDLDSFRSAIERGDELSGRVSELRTARKGAKQRAADTTLDEASLASINDELTGIDLELESLTKEGASLKALTGGIRRKDVEGKVLRRRTGLKKVQGTTAKMGRKGEFQAPDQLRDAYVWGDRDLRRTLTDDVAQSNLALYGHEGDRLESALRENYLSQGWKPIEYGSSLDTRKAWRSAVVEQVNRYIRNDKSMMRMALGAQDDEIVSWLRNTPEGREYWATQKLTKGGDPKWSSEYEFVDTQRQHFDLLVPSRKAEDVVVARDITPDDVDSWWGEADSRPVVPSNVQQSIEMSGRQQVAKLYDSARQKYFNLMSTLPETYMGRHPQYIRQYQGHISRMIGSSGRESFTQAEIRNLRKRADWAARQDMGKIMFDTSHKSNLGYHLRFISPFYSAWEDTMVKWGRIFAQRPEMAPLMYKAFSAPGQLFHIEDDDGNRIMPNGDVYATLPDGSLGEKIGESHNPNEGNIIFGLPDWAAEKTGAKDVALSRSSLNAIFQGDLAFLPGLGPVASVPVNEYMRDTLPFGIGDPAMADKLKVNIPGVGTIDAMSYLQPFGQTDASIPEQFMPGWMQNVKEVLTQDSRRSQQIKQQLMSNQYNAESLGLTPQLKEQERIQKVNNQAKNWWILRLIGSETPVSTRPQSRLEWYFQEFRRYRDQFGGDAEEKFMEDYPDYGEATISASFNETGIAATISADKSAEKWKAQIATHPNIGWMLAGVGTADDEFSDAVYTKQLTNAIDPSVSDKTSRRARTDDEIRTGTAEQMGWNEWSHVQRQLDLKAEELGLKSVDSAGGAELQQIRDEFRADLMSRNPEWARAYNKGSENGANPVAPFIDSTVDALSSKPELVRNRPDLQAMADYIQVRDQVRARMVEGGFKSTSQEFKQTELYAVWDEYVTGLRRDNPQFEEIYLRAGLDRDNLADPVPHEKDTDEAATEAPASGGSVFRTAGSGQ